MFVTQRWPWVRWQTYWDECLGLRQEMAKLVDRENSYVQTVERLTRTTLDLREDLREQREWARTLVQQIVEMRREGFEKAPATAVLPPRKADPVQDAIALAAKNDASLRRHLGAFARTERAAGTADDEIVAKVLHWEEEGEGE